MERLNASAAAHFQNFMAGGAAKGVRRFFDDLKAGAEQATTAVTATADAAMKVEAAAPAGISKITDEIEKLKKESETAGMGDMDKKLFELKGLGADQGQLDQAAGYLRQIDALKEQKKAQENATKAAMEYFDATRTPQEEYVAELEKINELVASGMLDGDVAQRAADAAALSLEKAGGDSRIAAPAIADASSQQAATVLAGYFNSQGSGSGTKKSRKSNARAGTTSTNW